ncbi:hypothetical protein CTI12_AA016730 [Artemisia annua]|uniref:Lipase-like C-terminal domain-containing protein n=1 Tax=Artemisia annua TaxID=35608 RepID=A0A2U1QKU2_ARTAN|nr:hypothetical protein CTI12_AA016730 [Artemisia annua]
MDSDYLIKLVYGFSAVADDLSLALNDLFFKSNIEGTITNNNRVLANSDNNDLPLIVLVHGILALEKGARELFYYLKGGQVDYGEEHSKNCGHSQFGRIYEQGEAKAKDVPEDTVQAVGQTIKTKSTTLKISKDGMLLDFMYLGDTDKVPRHHGAFFWSYTGLYAAQGEARIGQFLGKKASNTVFRSMANSDKHNDSAHNLTDFCGQVCNAKLTMGSCHPSWNDNSSKRLVLTEKVEKLCTRASRIMVA